MMTFILRRTISIKLYVFAIGLGVASALLVPTATLVASYSSNWTTLIPQNALLLGLLLHNTAHRPIHDLVTLREKEFTIFVGLTLVNIIASVGYYLSLTFTYFWGGAGLGTSVTIAGLITVWSSHLLLLVIIAIIMSMTFLVKRPSQLVITAVALNFAYHYAIEMFVLLPLIIGG